MSHHPLYDRPRLERPALRAACGEGPQQPASWDEAIERAASILLEAAGGADALGAIVSARLTLEDLHMARRVLKDTLGITRVMVPLHESGEDDHLLIRRDRTPNARGAEVLGYGAPEAAGLRGLAQDLASGRVRGLVVVGEDPVGEGFLNREALSRLAALVVLDWWRSPTVEAAQVALPLCGYGEADGTLINFQGRAQRLRAALKPFGEAEPAWRALQWIGQRCGLAAAHADAGSILDDAARSVPALAGLSARAIGAHGVPLKGA